MQVISVEEAQAGLPELLDNLAAGEEIVITRNAKPIAKLVGAIGGGPGPIFGAGKGKIEILADDDDHLEHFKDYLP